jgi:hypothetical protein
VVEVVVAVVLVLKMYVMALLSITLHSNYCTVLHSTTVQLTLLHSMLLHSADVRIAVSSFSKCRY